MSTSKPSLEQLRQQIDQLDEQIVNLLNQRAEAARQIGQIKAQSGGAIFAPDREKEIFQRIADLSSGPLEAAPLQAIYRELMSASFALERRLRIGFLGPQGSYSHEAALGQFGASVEYEPLADIHGVFEELLREHLDYGIVPVENSTAGAVGDTLEGFIDHDVQICAEVYRAIHHNLMAQCPFDEIETIYSKPEVFNQCQRWLSETGLSDKLTPVSSTSKAAEMAAEQAHAAAIGSRAAARLYNLQLLAERIEDNPDNATRFLIIGRDQPRPTGEDRTSILFTTSDQAGALVNVLLEFQKAGVNMTMITSRPSRRADQEYVFFVDAEGHADDETVKKTLDAARAHCSALRVLGSYPKSTRVV